MKVATIGAGLIGVNSACELSAAGHQVTLFERCASVAAEASFANARLIAPGYVMPWAAPGMPGTVVRHVFRRHTPVRLRSGLSRNAVAWLWPRWRACRAPTYRANRLRMQRLAGCSRKQLHELTHDLKLGCELTDGGLGLLRSAKELALAEPAVALLGESNGRVDIPDPAQCLATEPGLNPYTSSHAGIHLPDGEVGNCHQFAHLLRHEAQQFGARFRFDPDMSRISGGPQPSRVRTCAPPEDSGRLTVHGEAQLRTAHDTLPMPSRPITEALDAIVVCAALGAAALRPQHGLTLPSQALHGYSITALSRTHEAHPSHGPRSAVTDGCSKVAISRFDVRVRAAGGADIVGALADHHDGAITTPHKVLHDWFPGAARRSQVQRWKGARPMLPAGPTARRCSRAAASTAAGSTAAASTAAGSTAAAMAPAARRWPAVRPVCWPTAWPAEPPPSTPMAGASNGSCPDVRS